MMEKIKDVLYDGSDILLAFVIILIMSTVITWKVSDLLAYSNEQSPELGQVIHSDIKENSTVPKETDETNLDQNSSTNKQENDNQNNHNDNTTPSSQPSQEPAPVQQPTVILVKIPNGTPGIGIANILKEQGLIDNTAQFISRADQLKLSSKLRSGTFSIKSDTSLDDIIYIITGQKK